MSRNEKISKTMMSISSSTPLAFAFLKKSFFLFFSFSLFSCKIIGRLSFSSSFFLLHFCLIAALCISCSCKSLTLPDGSQFASAFPHLHIFFFCCLESCKFSLEVELCCYTQTVWLKFYLERVCTATAAKCVRFFRFPLQFCRL